MKAFTFKGDSVGEVRDQLEDLINEDYSPSLAILFASVSHDFMEVSEFLSTNGVRTIGASSAGEIVDDEVTEYGIVGMLLDMKHDNFTLGLVETGDRTTFEISQDLAHQAEEAFANPAIMVISGGLSTDGEEIIRGVVDILGEEVMLIGGLAADDFNMEATYVFADGHKTSDGIAALIVDNDRVEMSGVAASGWEEVGIEKTITRSKGNVVYTIDDEPALQVFNKYFGVSVDADAKTEFVSTLGAQYPLQVMRDNGKAVLRAPLMGNNEEGSVMFAGGIPQGAKVKFSISPGFDIIERIIEDVTEFHQEKAAADALILFSCKARHLALGPMVEDEIAGMRRMWDAPLIGFFTYGEIGKLAGENCDFHNETCSLLLLKEK